MNNQPQQLAPINLGQQSTSNNLGQLVPNNNNLQVPNLLPNNNVNLLDINSTNLNNPILRLNNLEQSIQLLLSDSKYSNDQNIIQFLSYINSLKIKEFSNFSTIQTNTTNNNYLNNQTSSSQINSVTSNLSNFNMNTPYRKNKTFIAFYFNSKDKSVRSYLTVKYKFNSNNNYNILNNNDEKIKVTPKNMKEVVINKDGINFDGYQISFRNFFDDNKDHILTFKKKHDPTDSYEDTPNQK
jgi:hypothetical protein